MSAWDPYDFAVTHVKTDDAGEIQALKGRVIEEGTVREVPIELPTPKAIEYLGYEGRFCVASEENGELTKGPEIVATNDETEPLITEEGSEVSLSDLPEPT